MKYKRPDDFFSKQIKKKNIATKEIKKQKHIQQIKSVWFVQNLNK